MIKLTFKGSVLLKDIVSVGEIEIGEFGEYFFTVKRKNLIDYHFYYDELEIAETERQTLIDKMNNSNYKNWRK